MDAPLRVAVLGAGGVGGLVAGLLARRGDGVTLLATGRSADVVRERGIEVHSRLLGDLRERVGVAAELEGPVDACIVAVKAPDLEAALVRVPAAALADALVVPFLNGVEHVAALRRRYPGARVLAASIRVESARTAPGRIDQTSPFAMVEIAVRPEIERDATRLADHLRDTGLEVVVREDEAGLLWDKLIFLAPLALLTTHSAAPAGMVRTERREEMLAVVEEIAAVATAEGASVDAAATVAALDAVPGSMTSSMQRDAAARRPIELEAIGGSIIRAAARNGIPTPVTARLVDELRARVSWGASGQATR
jgi:2-dehydropantoate 2-reductase